ncbi:uncharacterized protein TRUGW13939_03814 [Talaromyces rugulosus]|uniref:Uncharacterized protein n=1 Tax=Talaromyces rugulosus TaxID=121627 RepID=A0A7H8QSF5_TALRU|nr:uncharacterized protein TRUGW13939_03814 [Talaromyces rugulosus]QKX56708.1 hypothetical protein TRUGW13939_03814 [Talaromyces rugulosus]
MKQVDIKYRQGERTSSGVTQIGNEGIVFGLQARRKTGNQLQRRKKKGETMAKASRHEGSHDQEPWAIAFSAFGTSSMKVKNQKVKSEVESAKQSKANRQD